VPPLRNAADRHRTIRRRRLSLLIPVERMAFGDRMGAGAAGPDLATVSARPRPSRMKKPRRNGAKFHRPTNRAQPTPPPRPCARRGSSLWQPANCHHEKIMNVDHLPGDLTVPSFRLRGQIDRRFHVRKLEPPQGALAAATARAARGQTHDPGRAVPRWPSDVDGLAINSCQL
jgi:hypothetical protein